MTAKGQTYSPEVFQAIGGILLNAASGNSRAGLLTGVQKPDPLSIDPEEYKELLGKPLWQLTGEQYQTLTKGVMISIVDSLRDQEPSRHLVYGIDGLAKFLGTSRSTAQRIKRSGIIDDAIAQNGRTIVIDGDMALQLLKDHKAIGGETI